MNTLINQVLSQLNLSSRNVNIGMDMQMSTESLDKIDGSPYQSEIIYNQHLPYADKLDEEADTLLANIKANFGRCVMLRDINPGSVYWSQMLHKYIELYGLRFTKEEHIALVKLNYELVTIPGLDPPLVDAFTRVLLSLLKKKEVLSPSDLELPWRPLYEICNTLFVRTSKQVAVYYYPLTLEGVLEQLVKSTKIYFPLNTTQELLDEIRPMICPFDHYYSCRAMKIFRWFLPVQLAAKHHYLGHELWFQEFMKLWEACYNDHSSETSMMKLLAQLASNNIGYIDWNPYVPIMFTRFVRSFNLPVHYKSVKWNNGHDMYDMSCIGEWIASVLGNHSNAQDYLDKFLKTIETYLHPANFGPWLSKLEELVVKIIHFVVLRLHKERYGEETWELKVPDSHKLTEANVDAFVSSIMPVVMTGVFNDRCSQKFCTALQYLATLRANLVIPCVLEKVYPTIGTDIEPHKLITAMYCMISIARPLAQGSRATNKEYAYPEGPAVILPLLFSSLPGIDINDPAKYSATLALIATYVTLVPLVNCSTLKVKPETEEEHIVCEETSRFEDFVLQFMERVCAMIESSSLDFIRLENSSTGEKSPLEHMAENSLAGTFISIMVQTSESIFTSAINKFRTYIANTILETKIAGQLVGVMCNVFAKVNAKLTLRCLLPDLSERILEALSDDAAMEEEQLDNQLMFSLLLMVNLTDTQGDALLSYTDTIVQVLDKAIKIKSREGHILGSKILLNVLKSLCIARPIRLDKNLDDPEHAYWKDWGESVDVKTDRLKWYMPGEKEYAAADSIFKRYFIPALNTIKCLLETKNEMPREDLQSALRIIGNVLTACETVLPLWSEAPLVSKAFESCVNTMEPVIGNKYEIKMPDGSNVRQTVVRIIASLQEFLLQSGEDDTKSLNYVTLIWFYLSMNKSKHATIRKIKQRAFRWSKKIVEDKYTGDKGYLPELLLERVALQHELRRQMFARTFTQTGQVILLNSFNLSVSHYSEVRRKAQPLFNLILDDYPNAYESILPRMVEVLGRDTEVHHDAYKGALYIIMQNQKKTSIKNEWHMLSEVVPALVLSKPSEKPSVIKCQDFIVRTVKNSSVTINITLNVPDTCVKAAAVLWSNGIEPSIVKPTQSEIEKGATDWQEFGKRNLQFYYGLLNKLVDAVVEKNLHWRHRQMAMTYMRFLVHPEHPVPAPIVRYFVNALNHESADERKLAWQMTARILKILKRKSKKVVLEIPNRGEGIVKPGRREDNAWLQYSYEKRPLTAEQWDELRCVDKPYIGCYAWPKKLAIDAPPSEQPSLDKKTRKLSEQEQEIDRFFSDDQNVAKLVEYLTIQESKGQRELFYVKLYTMFKELFRNHGDAYLSNFLKHVTGIIQDKQDSVQRFASQFVAGVISGSKNWPFHMIQNMWQQMLPIIKQVLNNLTEETIEDWSECFRDVFHLRDPRKLHWLLEFLVKESQQAQQEASFIECARLTILETSMAGQAWRLSELFDRLLPRFEDRLLENPFDNVRNKLASVLVTIFDANVKFDDKSIQYPEIDGFVDKVYPYLTRLLTEEDKKSPTSIESTKLLSTVCHWIVQSIKVSHFGAISSFYKLYPIISQVENDEKEEELSSACRQCLAVLAQAFILPQHVPAALQAIKTVSKSSSWSARASCVQFLQVLSFHNMSTLLSNDKWIETVRHIVLELLQDERVEVRCCAAQMLNGMLHCTLVQDRQALLDEFKRLAKTKLKSKKSVSSVVDVSKAIRLRHAGVLGLCAFIQAHPYDIPKDIPPIFEHLSAHLSDPEPIPTTIRKTLNDFKRTHCDGWTGLQGLSLNLTEDQFTLLQDLTVPPLYYA